jgi:adenylate cyclase
MTANQSEAPWPALRRASRTVVVVDVVESVRLMEQDEDDTIRRWQSFVGEVVTRLLPQSGGRLVKSLGDGLMLEFESVPPAIQCALAMQQAIQPHNHGRASERLMCLRIGAHVADVVVDERDIYGSGVNLAARLATLAGPGEIVVSSAVRDQLVPELDADVEDLGDCHVKHVQKPVRVYRVGLTGPRPVITSVGERYRIMQPTVAVIPFDCLGADAGYDVLGDVIADGVIAQLSGVGTIHVISRLSSSVFRGRQASPAQVASLLGATYVLSGSFNSVKSVLSITAELADTRSARVIWAERIVVTPLDPLQTDSEAIHRIRTGVCRSVLDAEAHLAKSNALPTLESHSLLLGSIALMHRASRADFERVREMLEHLVSRNPHAPIPRAWLAKWHVLRVTRGWTHDEQANAREAIEQTQRALDDDPSCALALVIEGFVHCHMQKNLGLASLRYGEALAANPSESLAWLLASVVHAFKGEGDQATVCANQAMALSPLDPMRYYYDSLAATAALSAADFPKAIELAMRSLRANRTHTSTLRVLAIAHAQLEQIDEAREWVRVLRETEHGLTVRSYLARSPAAAFDTGRSWAEALRRAGLPD